MMWSQLTVDEWRSCVDDVVTCSQWMNGGVVWMMWSQWMNGGVVWSSQWMNGGVVWMMWSHVVTVDEWRSCVDDVVTAHSG